MAFVRNIAPKDLGKYERQLVKNAPGMLEDVMRNTARAAKEILKAKTREVDAVASGKYLAGWSVKKGRRGEIVVSNKQFYAYFIERGRRPGRRPPIAAIQKWVEVKFGLSGKKGRSVAYAVAKKIGDEGYKGRYVVLSQTPKIAQAYRSRLQRANAQWLRGKDFK